jgi:hypothetical protein
MKDEECMFCDCIKGGVSWFACFQDCSSCNILPTLDVRKKYWIYACIKQCIHQILISGIIYY